MPAQKEKLKTAAISNKISMLLVMTTLGVVGCDRQPAVGQTAENLSFVGFTVPIFTPPPPCNPHSHPDITNDVCDCDPGYKVVGYDGPDIYPLCGIALPCYPHSSPDVTGHVCDCDPGYVIDRFPGADFYPICRPTCHPGTVRVGDACVCDAGLYDDGSSTTADPSCQPCTSAMMCDRPGNTLASASCPADQVLTAAGCVCNEGFYDAGSDGVVACVACPPDGACPMGTTAATLTATPGFFRTEDATPTFSRCLVPSQCN